MIVYPKISVWLTNEHQDPRELSKLDPEQLVNLTTLSAFDMSKHGWILVGEAQVEIKLHSPEELLQYQLEALKARKAEYQKEAMDKLEEYDHLIQQLLALPAPEMTSNDPF